VNRTAGQPELLREQHDGNPGILIEGKEDFAVRLVELLQNDHFLSCQACLL
jgi:hypothetical protein